MKLIYRHENMMILHSIKNILEFNDIECFLKNEHGHTMGAEFGLSNTLLELYLSNEADFERASKVIEEHQLKLDTAPDWNCNDCGETNEGNFGSCWKCQNIKTA